MIVSIHQPQYLPWLPYLLKIAESDLFIILDSVDFQKNGLQNRNQIKTAQGATWLTVPVRQKLGQKILEVEINNGVDWRKKHWNTIVQNYGRALAFHDYAAELEGVYQRKWNLLADLDLCVLEMFFRWMKIDTPTMRSSKMGAQGKGSDLILNLCREMGATRYLSGTGGRNYLDEDAFRAGGVEIVYFSSSSLDAYLQLHPKLGFLEELSALDILLNCGERWRSYIGRKVKA